MKFLLCVYLSLVFLLAPYSVLAASPRETMQNTVEQIISVLEDPLLKDRKFYDVKKDKVWEIVDRVFDYDRLSRYVLGKKWKGINAEQQQEFTKLFSRLLGRSYMKKIMSYGDEKILVEKERPLSDEVTEVHTKIFSRDNKIPVYYRMTSVNGEWKVFDVIIEGVSLTKNYRSQFKNFLVRKNMDQLLKVLRKKTST